MHDGNALELTGFVPPASGPLHKNIKYSVGPNLAALGPLEVQAEGSSRGVPAPPWSLPGNLGDPPPSPQEPAVGDACGGGDALSRSGDPSRSRAGFGSPAKAAKV